MIKLHQDTAEQIAEIINSIEVCHLIMADAENASPMSESDRETHERWNKTLKTNTLELGDTFGIYLPNYENYKGD